MQPAQRRYVPPRYIDSEDLFGNVILGEWRNEVPADGFRQLPPNDARNATNDAKMIREVYADYFMKKRHVSWQWNKLPEFQREFYRQQAER